MRRSPDIVRGIIVAWALVVSCTTALSAAVPEYTAICSQLQRSAVPVLLPRRIPAAFGSLRSLTVIRADRDGYYVGFSNVRNCYGALSCATIHVAGYRTDTPAGRLFGSNKPLRLPDGSRGYYTPRDCSGSSCTESSLTFERDGAIYEIDAKFAHDDLPAIVSVYRALQPPEPHLRRDCRARRSASA